MLPERLQTYADFWPCYLREHSRPVTRALHVLGTLGGFGLLILSFLLRIGWLVPVALVFAYGLAWIGHFGIERNRPATFRHPVWSLRADLHMVALALCGRLGPELRRHLGRDPENPI
jgi:hypothetical protein